MQEAIKDHTLKAWVPNEFANDVKAAATKDGVSVSTFTRNALHTYVGLREVIQGASDTRESK